MEGANKKKVTREQPGGSMGEIHERLDRVVEEVHQAKTEIATTGTKVEAMRNDVADIKASLSAHLEYCKATTIAFATRNAEQSTCLQSMKTRHKMTIAIIVAVCTLFAALGTVLALFLPR